MKILFRTETPVPFRRMILLLILSLVSAYFVLQHSQSKQNTSTKMAMISISPIVPDLNLTPTPPPPQWTKQSLAINRNQTFSQVMLLSGVAPETVQDIYDSAKDVYNLGRIQAGKTITIVSSESNGFEKMEYSIDPLQTLVVRREEGPLKAELIQRKVDTKVEEVGGFINGSLYSSLGRLGEGDELVMHFANIFEWDVDFFTDLQEGDSFRIIFEKKYVEGEPLGYGQILAAELSNKGHLYQAIGYDQEGKLEYYSPDGKAMKKAFLAAPLKFSRISSGFTRSRFHPILKRSRPHYGIDYAAPAGTPVRTIGNGKVISAGWGGGAGKVIKIQHDKEISTLYCHLSRFAPGVRAGGSVSQGQVIGYVGSTGLATGPHLDFRFMKKGQYINFLSLKSPQATPLSASEIAKFQAASADIIRQLGQVEMRKDSDVAHVTVTAANFRLL